MKRDGNAMIRINFSDNIRGQGRNLHLQTDTVDTEYKIISRLFDGGRVLAREEGSYDPKMSEVRLHRMAEAFHSEKMVSIEMLYAISARVKTVRHVPSLNKLGKQFLRWNLLDEAIREFELALQYDQYFGELYLNLGESYIRRGSFNEAISILKKGVHTASRFCDMWNKLGIAYLRNSEHHEAIEAFEKAILINNSYDEAHFSMALCLIEMLANGNGNGKVMDPDYTLNMAKEHLTQAVTISNRFQNSMMEEGMRKLHHEEIGRALTIFWKVQESLAGEVDLDLIDSFYLGFLYGDNGKELEIVQRYVEKLEEMSRKHPTYPDLHNELGIAYMIQCRDLFNRALHQFRWACKINPQFKRASNNLQLTENEGKGLLILLRSLMR